MTKHLPHVKLKFAKISANPTHGIIPAILSSHNQPDVSSAPVDRPPRKSVVVAGIVAGLLVFLAAVSLLAYRALLRSEPSNVLLVQGNPNWLGAEVLVTGAAINRTYRGWIDASDRYSVPFFLPPGRYEVSVRINGVQYLQQTIAVNHSAREQILLPRDLPATPRAESSPEPPRGR